MSIPVQQMADRVAELIEARLQVKGEGLSEKVRRGSRHLPKKILAAASTLARNDEIARIPKLFRQVDQQASAQAYDVCVRYLQPLGAGKRRVAYLWGVVRSATGGLLVTGLAGAVFLAWHGIL